MKISYATFVKAILLGVLFSGVAAASGTSSTSVGLSTSEKLALRKIARTHPTTAVALLFLDRSSPSGTSGVMQFEGLPSLAALDVLLDSRGATALDAPALLLPRSPYSTATYFVEVRWTFSQTAQATSVVSTRVEVVDSEGRALRPRHVLEAPVSILLGGGTFAIAEPAGETSSGPEEI